MAHITVATLEVIEIATAEHVRRPFLLCAEVHKIGFRVRGVAVEIAVVICQTVMGLAILRRVHRHSTIGDLFPGSDDDAVVIYRIRMLGIDHEFAVEPVHAAGVAHD